MLTYHGRFIMKLRKNALPILAIALVLTGWILITHPCWNFPRTGIGYTVGEYWQSEWGERTIANYIIGAALLISGSLSLLHTMRDLSAFSHEYSRMDADTNPITVPIP
jgi:hypothetical protein